MTKKIADIEQEEQEITTAIFTKSPSKEERIQLEEKRESYRTERGRLEDELKNLQESIDESFDIVWESLHTLLEAKNLFGTNAGDIDASFEPKRNLLISLVSNLKFVDGELTPEWRFPFSIMAS